MLNTLVILQCYTNSLYDVIIVVQKTPRKRTLFKTRSENKVNKFIAIYNSYLGSPEIYTKRTYKKFFCTLYSTPSKTLYLYKGSAWVRLYAYPTWARKFHLLWNRDPTYIRKISFFVTELKQNSTKSFFPTRNPTWTRHISTCTQPEPQILQHATQQNTKSNESKSYKQIKTMFIAPKHCYLLQTNSQANHQCKEWCSMMILFALTAVCYGYRN